MKIFRIFFDRKLKNFVSFNQMFFYFCPLIILESPNYFKAL